MPFSPADRLLLYTDGVSETRDGSGEFFPLPGWLRGQGEKPPRALPDPLHQDLLRFSRGPLDDDIAALAVRRMESGGRPPRPAG